MNDMEKKWVEGFAPVRFRAQLVGYIKTAADSCEEQARHYPDDLRYERCAEKLRALARYVASLPDDDERLRRIKAANLRARLRYSDAPEEFGCDRHTVLLIERFGFDPDQGDLTDPDELLQEVAEIEREAAERGGGRQYVYRWTGCAQFLDVGSIAALIDFLEKALADLKAMQAARVEVEDVGFHFVRLVTTDPKVAARFGMEREEGPPEDE